MIYNPLALNTAKRKVKLFTGILNLNLDTTSTQPAAQHSTAQHSTAQHSTAQHSTAQHSTAQHSTAHNNSS